MTTPKTQDKNKIAITLNLPIRDYERIVKQYVDTGEFINVQDFIRYLIKNHFNKELKE